MRRSAPTARTVRFQPIKLADFIQVVDIHTDTDTSAVAAAPKALVSLRVSGAAEVSLPVLPVSIISQNPLGTTVHQCLNNEH